MNYNEIYFTHIRLINFQSWKDMTIDLAQGLNVVIAENGVGKSIIFKSIIASVLPDSLSSDDREDYIRHDETFAQIMYFFNDNTAYIINMSRYENSYYFIGDINNPTNELMGSKPPQDLLNRLGVIIRGNYVGNLIDMNQDLFLVDSDTSSDRSIINLLMSNENVDTLIYELENSKLPVCKDIIKQLTYKKNGIDGTLNLYSFKDIGVSESNLEVAEGLISGIESLVILESSLSEISSNRALPNYLNKLVADLDRIDEFTKTLESINQPRSDLGRFKDTCRVLNSLVEIVEPSENVVSTKFCEITNMLSSATELIISIERIFTIKEIPNSLFAFIDNCESLWKSSVEKLSGLELEKDIDSLKAELKDEEGEEYECPIYGKIKFVDQECIPYN